MKLNQGFKNVFTYAAGIEAWCKKSYPFPLNYTFCNDFAIADWCGAKNVRETFNRVTKEWLDDYKAYTEVAVSINLLAWANDQLCKQGFDRSEFVKLYSNLYYEARDKFYDRYEGNSEATQYYFDMTD